MKITIPLLCFISLMSINAHCQYTPYHKIKTQISKVPKSFAIAPVSYQIIPREYKPQKIDGLQIISMNRPGRTHDDIYFINKKGKAVHRSLKPTALINIHPNHRRHDSANPSGFTYENRDQAIFHMATSLISGILSL